MTDNIPEREALIVDVANCLEQYVSACYDGIQANPNDTAKDIINLVQDDFRARVIEHVEAKMRKEGYLDVMVLKAIKEVK